MRIFVAFAICLVAAPALAQMRTPLLSTGVYELRYSCEGRPLRHPAYANLESQGHSRWTLDIEKERFLYEHRIEVGDVVCELRTCGVMDYLRASDIIVMSVRGRQTLGSCSKIPFWGNGGGAWSLEVSDERVWGWNKLTDGLCNEGEALIVDYTLIEEAETALAHLESSCPNL